MDSISVQWCVQNESNIIKCQRCYQHILLLSRIKQALSHQVLAGLTCYSLSLSGGDCAQKAAGSTCNMHGGEDPGEELAQIQLRRVHRFCCCCCKPGTAVVNAGILLADYLNLHSVPLLQLQAISFLSLSFPFSTGIMRQWMWGPVSRAWVLTCSPVTIFNKGMF